MINNFKSLLSSKPLVGLSPLDGYTDEPFRRVLHELAPPDIYFTEFVSAEGLSRGGVKLYDTLLYSPQERPIVGQLFGKDPESFYKSAVVLCHLGFDGVDINMGCPAKTVTQHGSGAALIGQPELAAKIIKSARQGIDDWFSGKVTILDLNLNQKTLEVITRNLKYSNHTPKVSAEKPILSVKTRLGISEPIIDTWIPHLLSQPIDLLTLHGRTLKQGYAGVANWELIGQAAKTARDANIAFFGNGDISSRSQGLEFIEKYNLNGVLIGRAALGNPWVFSDKIPNFADKFSAMTLHATFQSEAFPHRRFDILRKHFLLYASGHPRAKELRSKIVSLNSLTELYALEADFLSC